VSLNQACQTQTAVRAEKSVSAKNFVSRPQMKEYSKFLSVLYIISHDYHPLFHFQSIFDLIKSKDSQFGGQ
jgi:hypothetical protein